MNRSPQKPKPRIAAGARVKREQGMGLQWNDTAKADSFQPAASFARKVLANLAAKPLPLGARVQVAWANNFPSLVGRRGIVTRNLGHGLVGICIDGADSYVARKGQLVQLDARADALARRAVLRLLRVAMEDSQ
jgi:hypothetical protein